MKVSAINSYYARPCLKKSISKNFKENETKTNNLPQDTVSFKGVKNALKGAGILGIAGAVVGAICSGGVSIIPTMIYFGACNGLIGAAAGSQLEDDDSSSSKK